MSFSLNNKIEDPVHFAVVISCNVRQMAPTPGRGSQAPHTQGDAKSKRHQDDSAVLPLVTQPWDYSYVALQNSSELCASNTKELAVASRTYTGIFF